MVVVKVGVLSLGFGCVEGSRRQAQAQATATAKGSPFLADVPKRMQSTISRRPFRT